MREFTGARPNNVAVHVTVHGSFGYDTFSEIKRSLIDGSESEARNAQGAVWTYWRTVL